MALQGASNALIGLSKSIEWLNTIGFPAMQDFMTKYYHIDVPSSTVSSIDQALGKLPPGQRAGALAAAVDAGGNAAQGAAMAYINKPGREIMRGLRQGYNTVMHAMGGPRHLSHAERVHNAGIIARAAMAAGVDPDKAVALAMQESSLDPSVVNSAGYRGFGQLSPYHSARYKGAGFNNPDSQALDPEWNARNLVARMKPNMRYGDWAMKTQGAFTDPDFVPHVNRWLSQAHGLVVEANIHMDGKQIAKHTAPAGA